MVTRASARVGTERPFLRPRRNKMGAKKVRAYVGVQDCKFDSQAEWKYALWLEREKQAGRVDSWRHHPGRIYLLGRLNKTVTWMEPDFEVWPVAPDPRYVAPKQYHEVKGMATAAWRIKRALFEQQHPAIPYVVIDAGHVDPPLLFDDRRKRKAARKRAKEARSATGKARATKKRGAK